MNDYATSHLYDALCKVQFFLNTKTYAFAVNYPRIGRVVSSLTVVGDLALETVKTLDLIEQVAFAALHGFGSFFSSKFSKEISLNTIKELPRTSIYTFGLLFLNYVLAGYSIYHRLAGNSLFCPPKKTDEKSQNVNC